MALFEISADTLIVNTKYYLVITMVTSSYNIYVLPLIITLLLCHDHCAFMLSATHAFHSVITLLHSSSPLCFHFSYSQLHRGSAVRLYLQKPLQLAAGHGDPAWPGCQNHLRSAVGRQAQCRAADACSYNAESSCLDETPAPKHTERAFL